MPTIITDISPTVLRRTGIGRVAFSVTHTHHVEELHWVQRGRSIECILTRKQGGRRIIIGWDDGIRTHNVSCVQDFKSCVSRQFHHIPVYCGEGDFPIISLTVLTNKLYHKIELKSIFNSIKISNKRL